MTKLFETQRYDTKIREIEVTRFNDKSYWYDTVTYNNEKKERRSSRHSSYSKTWETEQEAREYLIIRTNAKIERVTKELDTLKKELIQLNNPK